MAWHTEGGGGDECRSAVCHNGVNSCERRARTETAHMRAYTRRNESYARRTSAKLTRLECGARGRDGDANLFKTRKSPRLDPYPSPPPRGGSLRLFRSFSLSAGHPSSRRRLRPSGDEVARGYRNARFTTKNGQLHGRKFGTLADSFRPTVKISFLCAEGCFPE